MGEPMRKISPKTLSHSHPKKFQNPKRSSPFSLSLSLSLADRGGPKGQPAKGGQPWARRPPMGRGGRPWATAGYGARGGEGVLKKKNFFFLFLQIIDGMSLDLLVLIDFR